MIKKNKMKGKMQMNLLKRKVPKTTKTFRTKKTRGRNKKKMRVNNFCRRKVSMKTSMGLASKMMVPMMTHTEIKKIMKINLKSTKMLRNQRRK